MFITQCHQFGIFSVFSREAHSLYSKIVGGQDCSVRKFAQHLPDYILIGRNQCSGVGDFFLCSKLKRHQDKSCCLTLAYLSFYSDFTHAVIGSLSGLLFSETLLVYSRLLFVYNDLLGQQERLSVFVLHEKGICLVLLEIMCHFILMKCLMKRKTVGQNISDQLHQQQDMWTLKRNTSAVIIKLSLVLPLLMAEPRSSLQHLLTLPDFCYPFQEYLALQCIKDCFLRFTFTKHNKKLCRRDRGCSPRGSIPAVWDSALQCFRLARQEGKLQS